MLARGLGRVNYFAEDKERELLELKQKWGFSDPRNTPEYKNCDICANDVFRDSWSRAGVERQAFEPPPAMKDTGDAAASTDPRESLVKAITERVLAALADKK
jgi:L-fuculose-phosphate aldolase